MVEPTKARACSSRIGHQNMKASHVYTWGIGRISNVHKRCYTVNNSAALWHFSDCGLHPSGRLSRTHGHPPQPPAPSGCSTISNYTPSNGQIGARACTITCMLPHLAYNVNWGPQDSRRRGLRASQPWPLQREACCIYFNVAALCQRWTLALLCKTAPITVMRQVGTDHTIQQTFWTPVLRAIGRHVLDPPTHPPTEEPLGYITDKNTGKKLR